MMSDTQKTYENLKIKIKDSEADIQGEVPWEVLDAHRQEVLEELRQDFEAPGFRKGKVPMDVFLKHVRDDHVLEDAAERALQEAYPQIVEHEKLRTLGRPEVTITKLAAGNSLGFRIRIGVVPEVKLPDYKKIAKEVTSSEPAADIAPEEVQKVIDELLQLRGEKDKPAELNDDFVKSLGDFTTVDDFRAKLTENLKIEKKVERQRERREKIAEALSAKTKMTLPAGILDLEADAMQQRLEEDLKRANITLEDYAAKSKKTMEELRAEHRSYVERQLRTRFILEAIAEAEQITPDPTEVAAELRYMEAQHPESDREDLERYVANLLRNEKTLKFLEG